MDQDTIAGLLPAAAALALERVTYAVVWRNPEGFRDLCRRGAFGEPVDVLRRLFYAFKVIQGLVFLFWFAWYGRWFSGTRDAFLSDDPRAIAVGLAAILVGQTLNLAVFRRLGRVGVFYGTRFGLEVPWVTGFPFSVLAHPQYVGTVLTIWGLFVGIRFPHDDWALLPLLETFYYYLGAQFESVVPQPSSGSILSPRTKR